PLDAPAGAAQRESGGGGIVVGADGAYSAVRAAMQRRDRYDYSQLYLEHAYKELHIPPGRDGAHVLEKNALHIWPRGGFMMMAMANRDGSFTITLYLPVEGPFGFDRLGTPDAVRRFFEEQFPDAVPHLRTLLEDFFANPTGPLLTIRSRPRHAGGTAG